MGAAGAQPAGPGGTSLRVLGIDPGLGRTGTALVQGRPGALTLVASRCVETAPGSDGAARLAALLGEIETVVAETSPDVAAVEELYFSTNRTTAILVAQARGVVLCALARCGLEVTSYTPNQVKEAVAGWGGARKPQVARMTRRLLGVERIDGPDDVADACAVAITHHHRAGFGGGVRLTGVRSGPSALDRAVAAARARENTQ